MRWPLLKRVPVWRAILLLGLAACAPVVSAQDQAGLSVTTSSNRESVYSNEQILISVRVEVDSNAFGLTGEELTVENAQVLSLNKTKAKGVRNGRSTTITERLYAVFSTSTGTLEIPVLKFQAQMPVATVDGRRKTNPTLRASSQATSINVQPPPVSSNTWFPASSVALQSNWGNPNAEVPTLVPGEPVEISLSIKVTGQHPAAIPPLQMNTSSNLRSYPAVPEWEAYQSKLGFGGVLTQRVTLIASDTREAFIETLAVPWWDINARQWRVARLARLPLVVEGGGVGWFGGNRSIFVTLAVIFLTVAAFYAVVKFFFAGSRRVSEASAWRGVKRAVNRQDTKATRDALLVWCRLRWPGVRISGADSVGVLDAGLARVFRELEEEIFSAGVAVESRELDWGGIATTLSEVRRGFKNGDRSKVEQDCLYPSSRACQQLTLITPPKRVKP